MRNMYPNVLNEENKNIKFSYVLPYLTCIINFKCLYIHIYLQIEFL